MPIKYIGRTTDFCGKTLWEIVGNLKDFGVGRLVKRHVFDRYPEPSFFRIVKVEPVPNEDPRKVRVWAEKVFRGQRYPKLVEVYRVSYKADYRLIPKAEEEELWRRVAETPVKSKILPATVEFPPLLKYLLQEDLIANGKDPKEVPKLVMSYRQSRDDFYRPATEGETPTVHFPAPSFCPELYK